MVSREQSLRGKLANKTEEEQKRRQEANELEQQVGDLRKRLRNEETEHANSRKQVWDNDAEIKDLNDQLTATKVDLEKERKAAKDLEQKMEKGVGKLEGLKKIVTDQNALQKSKEQELRKEVETLKRQNAILKNSFKAMEKEIKKKSSNDEVSRSEISQLKAALEARNEFEKSFVDQMIELEDQLDTLQNEKQQLENLLQNMDATLHERDQLAGNLSEALHQKDAEILNLNQALQSFDKTVSENGTQCDPVIVKPVLQLTSRKCQTEQDPFADETEVTRLKRKLKEAQNEIEVLKSQLKTVGDNEREQKGELESLYTISDVLAEQRDINFKLREKVENNFEDMKQMELAIESLTNQNKSLEESLKHWELSGYDNSKEFISVPIEEFDKFHDSVRRMHDLERTLNDIEKSEKRMREKAEDETFKVLNYSNFYSQNQSTQTNAPEHIIFTPTQTIKSAISTYMEGDEENDVTQLHNPRSRVRVQLLMDMLDMVPKLNRVRLERGVISVDDVLLDDCGFASFMCPRNFQTSMHAQLQLIVSGIDQTVNDRLASVQMEDELTMQDVLAALDQDPVLDDLSRGQKPDPSYEALEKIMKARTQLIFDAWLDKENAEMKLEQVLGDYEGKIKDQKKLQNEVQSLNDHLADAISGPDKELFETLGTLAHEINNKASDLYELQNQIDNDSDNIKETAESNFHRLQKLNDEIDELRKKSQNETEKWLKKYEDKQNENLALETEISQLKEAVISLPGGADLVQKFEVDQQFDRHINAGTLTPEMMKMVAEKYPQIAQRINQTGGLMSEYPANSLPTLGAPQNLNIVKIVGIGSILVAWKAPRNSDGIQGYYIYVDNVKQSIDCRYDSEQAIVPLRDIQRPSLISVQSFSATLKSVLVTKMFPGREQFNAQLAEDQKPEKSDEPNFDQELVRQQVATFDYNPDEQSPNDNPEMELAFCEGDVITTYGDVRSDGFFYGEINGIAGLVPSNYVQVQNS